MPTPTEMISASEALGDHERVGKFLALLGTLMLQNGLQMEAEQPTEALKLECPECHKQYGVDDAAGYRSKVGAGVLYACASGHEAQVIGSGRHGLLSEDEQAALDTGKASIIVLS